MGKERIVQVYDFTRSERISNNQLRSLNFMHDRFARNVSSSISAYLRSVTDMSLRETEVVPYAQFLKNSENPGCFASINMKPLDGVAALEISPALAFSIVDRILGGVGKPIETPRPLTEIEQRILQNILKLLCEHLADIWRHVRDIDCGVNAMETDPHMVQVVPPNEMVISFKFQARLGETEGHVRIGYPILVLEPVIHVLDQETTGRKKILHDPALAAQLRRVPLKVAIETADTLFPVQSLAALQPGDTLVFDHSQDRPVQIKIAGSAKLLASPRIEASKRTFFVSGFIKPPKEDALDGLVTG